MKSSPKSVAILVDGVRFDLWWLDTPERLALGASRSGKVDSLVRADGDETRALLGAPSDETRALARFLSDALGPGPLFLFSDLRGCLPDEARALRDAFVDALGCRRTRG